MYDKLFEPIKIRGMELKNRIILPAMGTKFSENRHATQRMIDFHVARTRGGAGLNMIEVASVHAPSAPNGFMALCGDEYIPTLTKLTDAIHEAGGKAGIQLWQGNMNVIWDPEARVLAPSTFELNGQQIPALDLEEIPEIVDAYGQAARRAAEAGFDCIELHAAHNYLPHCFLSPAFNRREDEYGGSFENRMRFPLEVIEAIRANIPEDMPLFMRLDVFDDELDGGLTIDETIEFCKRAGKAGVDVLDVSRGNTSSGAIRFEVPPLDIPRAFNIDNASRVKKATGMITLAGGRVNTPELAERILETGKADMIWIGRSQIADPEFVNKARECRENEIVQCLGCNQGCYDGFCDFSLPFITCLRNPLVGHEGEEADIVAAARAKREGSCVAVVGGGIAGMQAAMLLDKIGCDVHLIEKNDCLGGRFLLAGAAPRKEEMRRATEAFAQQVLASGVTVHLGCDDAAKLVAEIAPNAVVSAVGATPATPPIPGADAAFVAQADDVLTGKQDVAGDIVVIGGGLVGIEAAELLSEKGCRVTVLEMLDDYGAGLGILRRICVEGAIVKDGIDVKTGVKVTKIAGDGVHYDAEGETDARVPADYVVIATGAKPADDAAVEAFCADQGIDFARIGDAKEPRRAIDAVREAYEYVYGIEL